ncbi:MAG: signal recognition particle-docking protein FtsY [Candidatus Zixiibacteriota bacterium]|nr:MAG: signal recognition particle-docking protein FtsY [candidate division Zixibacteria bacterium]
MAGPFEKLKQSLARTRVGLLGKISQVITRRKIDDDLLDDIEEILIEADVGVAATTRLIDFLREQASQEKLTDVNDIFGLLKEEITEILSRGDAPIFSEDDKTPVVWLIVGVNGVGKTTTIGKLATNFSARGKMVIIAACDTFRAAAIDQVAIWAERSNVEIVKSQTGSDPAAVAYDAAKASLARGADLLLVDTAGRLHTKSNLMEELKKIKRVIGKALPDAPIYSKLIIDGSTGQNAISQVKVFTEAVGCDGIIVTKLDGTAKGGIIIGVAEELGVPVDFVGLGEGIDDLQRFDAGEFTEALFE